MRASRFLHGFLASMTLGLCMHAGTAPGYPLDGYESTGITRLLHQRWIQEGELEGKKRPSGELMPLEMMLAGAGTGLHLLEWQVHPARQATLRWKIAVVPPLKKPGFPTEFERLLWVVNCR